MYYELYIDIFFLVNFFMDTIVLELTGKILKSNTSARRRILGAFFGALLTCVGIVCKVPPWGIPWFLFYILISVFLVKIGLALPWNKALVKGVILFYISSFLLGGIFTCFEPFVETGSIFFAVATGAYYLASGLLNVLTSVLKFGQFFCQVQLYAGEKCCVVKALVDTGNLLTDSLTGEKVHLVEPSVVKELYGEKIPPGLRYIPYHSVGKKSGILPIFVLDELCICGEENEWIRHPIIGITDHEISAKQTYRMILNPGP